MHSPHQLLQHLAEQVVKYLQLQIAAGVDVVMLFDSWGGILAEQQFRDFSLRYLRYVVSALRVAHPDIPVIVFSKNSGRCLVELAAMGCQGLGLDWTADLQQAKRLVGRQVVLQGNLDPAVLYADEATIRSEVRRILDVFGTDGGHIFNLGHGIEPGVDPDNVQILIDEVHSYSRALSYCG